MKTRKYSSERRMYPLLEAMIENQIHRRGLVDLQIDNAFRRFPREWFVPEKELADAYDDCPLPIGWGQTISQPYIVALMTQLLNLSGGEKVLEIGTGCGYQSAILSVLCKEVHSIEIVPGLHHDAKERLSRLSVANVFLYLGNGRLGLPEQAPFDRILCAAGTSEIPKAWVEQLASEGRIVVPLGVEAQDLVVLERVDREDGSVGLKRTDILPVRFVPLV